MWEASLLEFDCGTVRFRPSIHVTFVERVQQDIQLLSEHSRSHLWPVLRRLPFSQFSCDLWPPWIARNGDEVVRLAKFADDCHGVEELHVVVAWAPDKGPREDLHSDPETVVVAIELVTSGGQRETPAVDNLLHVAVGVSAQRLLVLVLVIQSHVLGYEPHGAEPLLPESTQPVDEVDGTLDQSLLIGQRLVTQGHVIHCKLSCGYPLASCSTPEVWMPSLVAPGAEECEVQGLVGAVLLGDMFEPSFTSGDNEVMGTTVCQHADFLQVGGQVVASGVLTSRSRLGTDDEFAALQLLCGDVHNLSEVLDVGVDALQLHLQIFNDLPHSLFL